MRRFVYKQTLVLKLVVGIVASAVAFMVFFATKVTHVFGEGLLNKQRDSRHIIPRAYADSPHGGYSQGSYYKTDSDSSDCDGSGCDIDGGTGGSGDGSGCGSGSCDGGSGGCF